MRLRDPEQDTSDRVTVELSRSQCVALARLARQARRKAERQFAKSTFVPEPGHRHAQEAAAKAWGEVETLLFKVGDGK